MPTRKQRRKKMVIFGISGGTMAAALILGLIAWLSGWFVPPPVLIEAGLPGSALGESAEFQQSKPVADDLHNRMVLLLKDDKTGLLTTAYQLAGRYGEPPAKRSDQVLAQDQLLYGTYLLEQGWQEDFQTWWSSFDGVFIADNGLVKTRAGQDEQALLTDDDFWRVNLASLRLLAQSCTIWPSAGRSAAMQKLSDEVLAIYGQQGLSADYAATVPTPAPTVDPAATPTPKPTATPAVTEPGMTIQVLRLATIDLFTMQSYAGLDERWQQIYEKYLTIVSQGYISDELPLYALGYEESQNAYVSFSGAVPSVNTEEALLTILRLCEIGQENPRSLNWLRKQLYNQRAIYESYHIAQGQPTSGLECVSGYAIVARIARINGDRDLYDAAIRRLLWHQATSLTSQARSAVFRENPEGLIFVYARDNTMALLALR
jgi:hypothetical protein